MARQSDIFDRGASRALETTKAELQQSIAELEDQIRSIQSRIRSVEPGNATSFALTHAQREATVQSVPALEAQLAELFKTKNNALLGLRQIEGDEQIFWYRRFHTSLALANAGAFLALATHLLDPTIAGLVAWVAATALGLFAVGLGCAGAIPFLLYRSHQKWAERLAATSACVFAVGVAIMVFGAFIIACTRALNPLPH